MKAALPSWFSRLSPEWSPAEARGRRGDWIGGRGGGRMASLPVHHQENIRETAGKS